MFKLIEQKIRRKKIGVKRINLMSSTLRYIDLWWAEITYLKFCNSSKPLLLCQRKIMWYQGYPAVAGSGYFAQKYTLTTTYRIWDMRSWKGHRDWIHPNLMTPVSKNVYLEEIYPWERNESLGIAEGPCLFPKQPRRKKGNDEAISSPIPHMFQCRWKMSHICVLMLASASNYSRMSSTALA